MRASCEPVPGSEVGTKENPPVGADGFRKSSHETSDKNSGPDFFAAFRVVIQARDVVEEVNETFAEIEKGRPAESFADWERRHILGLIVRALAIYRECYRGAVQREFEPVFGSTYETFETSLLELQHAFQGEGGA